jgi:hypothetical protein
MKRMIRIDELAEAALAGDALRLRSLTQDWLGEQRPISQCAPPESDDLTLRAIAAGLVEMLAERRKEAPPAWTQKIPGVPRPIYLLKAAQTMQHLRHLCETESPPPLQRRNLLAPPTFLQFA